jgi:hypothetical protein
VQPGTVIIADGLYNNATTAGQVQHVGARGCFSGLKAERISDRFGYEAQTDRLLCGQGKASVDPGARCT